MTEDLNNTHHEFNTIIDGVFSVSERELLRTVAETVMNSRVAGRPMARRWSFDNLPEYLKDTDTSDVERQDAIAFGIDGYFAFQFADTNLRVLNLLDELLTELTEGDNAE